MFLEANGLDRGQEPNQYTGLRGDNFLQFRFSSASLACHWIRLQSIQVSPHPTLAVVS